MKTPDLFDDVPPAPSKAELGRRGRDAGMRNAVEHADAVTPEWRKSAFDFVQAYAQRGKPFIAPQVREFAYTCGLPRPPTDMAWGAVLQRASRLGLIKPLAVIRYGDATMHTQNVQQWIKAE